MPRKQLIRRRNHCGYSDQSGSQTVSSRYIGIENPLTNSPQKFSLACTNLSNRSSGERHGFHSCGGTCLFHRDQICCPLTPTGRQNSIASANVNAAGKYCDWPIPAKTSTKELRRYCRLDYSHWSKEAQPGARFQPVEFIRHHAAHRRPVTENLC